MSEKSRRIVIDASIARRAGTTDYPASKSCREFLDTVLTICHQVVMTKAIWEEWNNHHTMYSYKWRASMVARKQVCWATPTIHDRALERLETSGFSDNNKAAMRKDWLLIEAALETDRVISSLDDIARNLFRQFSTQWGAISTVAWINPAREEEQAVKWLENGALPEKERLLECAAEKR